MLGSTYFYALLVRLPQDLRSYCSCEDEQSRSVCSVCCRKDSLAFVEASRQFATRAF